MTSARATGAAPGTEFRDLEYLAARISSGHSTLFVVGSAVSYASPANGPQAAAVIRVTIQALRTLAEVDGGSLPEATQGALENPPGAILPESLYASIAEVAPPGIHAGVWGHLARRERATGEVAAGPNRGHYAIVIAARRHGGLVLTTNFDTFLEDAAAEVGIPTHVLTLRDALVSGTPAHTGDALVVLKIHGDARDPASIISQAPDLSRVASLMRRLDLQARFEQTVLVGYSGRDLDVFPWLLAGERPSIYFWVDPEFGDEHRSWSVPNCVRVSGSSEELADVLLRRWSARGDRESGLALRNTGKAPIDGPRLAQQIEETARSATTTAFENRPDAAAWALARTFADIGRHTIARDLLRCTRASNAIRAVEALLLESFVDGSQDRYIDAQTKARQARQLSKGIGLSTKRKDCRARASLQAAYAAVVEANLVIPLMDAEPTGATERLRIRSPRFSVVTLVASRMATILWFLVVTLRYWPRARRAVRHARSSPIGTTSVRYRFACDYVEHLIRLVAFVGGALPRPLRRRAFRRIDALAQDIGYLVGALNAAKYLKRIAPEDRHAAVLARFAVLDDLVPRALEARDQAQLALESDQSPPPDNARELVNRAVHASALAGVPSLELKCEALRYQAGFTSTRPAAEIRALIASIQARRVRRQEDALVSLLASR